MHDHDFRTLRRTKASVYSYIFLQDYSYICSPICYLFVIYYYYVALKKPAFCWSTVDVRSVKIRIRAVVSKFPYSDRAFSQCLIALFTVCNTLIKYV